MELVYCMVVTINDSTVSVIPSVLRLRNVGFYDQHTSRNITWVKE